MTTNSIPVSTGVSHPVSRPSYPLPLTHQAARTASVLLPLIPASWVSGELIRVVETPTGIITVHATPDSDFGEYEVTAWCARTLSDIAQDLAEPVGDDEDDHDIPLIEYVMACTLQVASAIDSAVANALRHLGNSGEDATEIAISDEVLRGPRAGWGICACGKPNTIGHDCDRYSPRGEAALGRLEVWAAHVLRDRQTGDAARRELAGAA